MITEILEGNQFTMLGKNRLVVHTEITINAPAEKVWAAISDFDNLGAWSPKFKTVVGPKEQGASITAIYDFGTGTLLENPVKLTWQDGKRFGWSGGTLFGPDVYDNHQFMVVPVDEQTTQFIHTDDLTSTKIDGLLEQQIPVFIDFFQELNQTLKAYVEK